jgi:uncharacterized protein (DUF58 family)
MASSLINIDDVLSSGAAIHSVELDLAPDVAEALKQLSSSSGLGLQEMLHQSLSLSAQVKAARNEGGHLGIVTDPSQLDAEIVTGRSGVLVADLVRRLKPDEHDDDRKSRIKAADRSAFLEEVKTLILFITLLISVMSLAGLLSYIVFIKESVTPETQRWAQTTLSALVSGAFSFLLGRKIGGK